MQQSYLEVTFRGGRPLAAYYYLPRREDDSIVRVEKHRTRNDRFPPARARS